MDGKVPNAAMVFKREEERRLVIEANARMAEELAGLEAEVQDAFAQDLFKAQTLLENVQNASKMAI